MAPFVLKSGNAIPEFEKAACGLDLGAADANVIESTYCIAVFRCSIKE